MMDPVWTTLFDEARAVHSRLADLQAFCAFPEEFSPTEISPRDDALTPLMQSDAGLSAPEAMIPFRNALQAAAPHAFWRRTYEGEVHGEILHANFGCYEVIGRGTPLASDKMRSFVIYQKPGYYYPMHHHPAEELYLVVAGEGTFHMEGAPDQHLKPGETAFHPSNVPHALTTGEKPIIAYVLWRGDFETKPVWSYPETLE